MINTKTWASQESVLGERMREIKQEHASVISDKISSESASITSDGWASCANNFYMYFTLSYIDDAWDLVTPLFCSSKT